MKSEAMEEGIGPLQKVPPEEVRHQADPIADDGDIRTLEHYMGDKEEMLRHAFDSVGSAQLRAILPPNLKDLDSDQLKRLCLHQLRRLSDSAIVRIISGKDEEAGDGGRERAECADAADSSALEDPSGQTLMELRELEMRARAIKALLERQDQDDDDDDDVEEQLDDDASHPQRCQTSARDDPFRSSGVEGVKRPPAESSGADPEAKMMKMAEPDPEEDLDEDFGIQEVDIELGSSGSSPAYSDHLTG